VRLGTNLSIWEFIHWSLPTIQTRLNWWARPSGAGVSIAANKIKGVYASVCHDTYTARQAVQHDDMNVLSLGPRVIGPEMAHDLIVEFLGARFIGNDPGQERHLRRVRKVKDIEDHG
jgi:RpiB/LacA/LacB family sugar-phosphate isomerase